MAPSTGVAPGRGLLAPSRGLLADIKGSAARPPKKCWFLGGSFFKMARVTLTILRNDLQKTNTFWGVGPPSPSYFPTFPRGALVFSAPSRGLVTPSTGLVTPSKGLVAPSRGRRQPWAVGRGPSAVGRRPWAVGRRPSAVGRRPWAVGRRPSPEAREGKKRENCGNR